MAEAENNKNNQPVDYGDSTYSNGGLVDALDGGMHHNAQYIGQLGALNDLMGDATARIASESDPEVDYEELRAQLHDENEAWLDDAYSQLSKDCRINAVLNGTAIAISGVSAVTSAAGAASYLRSGMADANVTTWLGKQAVRKSGSTLLNEGKAQVAQAQGKLWSNQLLNSADKVGRSTLSRIGLKTAGYTLKAGEKLFGAAHHVSGIGTGKTSLFRLGAATAIEVAPTALPLLAAHIYTTGRTEDVKQEYVDAIRTQQGVYDYLVESGGELSGTIKEDYTAWQENYAKTQSELLEAFNTGVITKEEYDEKYGQFLESSQESLDKLTETHKEAGQYILGKGAASAMGEEIIAHGVDPVTISRATPYLEKLAEENPDVMEATKAAVDARKATSSGNAFVDFLSNMHASLIHYLPGAAYVEAVIVKGADVVMDFVANRVPIVSNLINYEQKHEGESISDIASAISDSAEAKYEQKQEADALAADVSKEQDWQAAAGNEASPGYA